MFAAATCACFLSAAMASDPVAELQQRYPAHRVTLTTPSGTAVYYTLGRDVPASLRRAYKVLEVAEREVLITDALHQLELEYVQNERQLEGLRSAYMASYLSHMIYPSQARGPSFNSLTLLGPPETALKWAVTTNAGSGVAAERAIRAIDRLTEAEYQLQQTLLELAFPDRKRQPVPPPPPGGGIAPIDNWAQARDAEIAAGRELALAADRERAAYAKDLAAQNRYRSATAEQEAARQMWSDARQAWDQAQKEWTEARQRWIAARDHAAELRAPTGATRPAPPTGSLRVNQSAPFAPARNP